MMLMMMMMMMMNSLESNGYSVLHWAARKGEIRMVQMLLDSGACEDDRTEDGNTPLALAARVGHDDILELLIQRGCNVNNADK